MKNKTQHTKRFCNANKDEPATLIRTNNKYIIKNTSPDEKYNLAFGFVQSFMIVKNIITNAKLPILSEGIKIDETINKAKHRKINLSIFCKTKLFLYKFCVIFCAKEKILFKNIYITNLNYYSHQHSRLLFHRKLLHLKLSR